VALIGLTREEENQKKITKAQDHKHENHFLFAGGNSQENFTKNLCWRRIGLTRLKT
jgi:hypothetical protein